MFNFETAWLNFNLLAVIYLKIFSNFTSNWKDHFINYLSTGYNGIKFIPLN